MSRRRVGGTILSSVLVVLVTACSGATAPTSPPPSTPSPAATPTTAGVPSPTGTASAAAETASPSPTAQTTPSIAMTPAPLAPPTASPAPTARPDGWIGPELIGASSYGQPSLAVDADGFVHAALVRNGRIQYLTNRSGGWATERVTAPDGYDDEPSIALDSDGAVWIAFTRWAPEDPDICRDITDCVIPANGVFYVTNESGSWSDAQRLAPPESNAPSLEMRNSAVHLGYVAGTLCGELCAPGMVHYKTNATGSWSDVAVGETMGQPELAIGTDGRAHLAYWNVGYDADSHTNEVVVDYAVVDDAAGPATTETVWAGRGSVVFYWVEQSLMALDAADYPHVVAEVVVSDEGDTQVMHSTRGENGWTELSPPPAGRLRALDVDQDGALHLFACCAQYLTNRSGDYETVELASAELGYDTVGDITVDRQGRPHTLFVVNSEDENDLWYALGPAD